MKQRTSLSAKLTAGYSILIVLVALVLTVSLYFQLRSLQRRADRERLEDIISFAIPQVDGDFHALIRSRLDEAEEFHRYVYNKLRDIQQTSSAIQRIYTLRQLPNGQVVYVIYVGPQAEIHVNDPYTDIKPGMQPGLTRIQTTIVESEPYRGAYGMYWIAYAPIYDHFGQQDGVLVIETDAEPLLKAEAQARLIAFAAFFITAPVFLLIGQALTRHLTAPLHDLVEGTRRITQGNLGYQVPVRSYDEIGVLSDTFNQMSTQLLQTLSGLEEKVRQLEEVEHALRKSEERFRRLAENAPDIIFRFRLQPRPHHEYISPAVASISGYSVEEHYASPLLMLRSIHPDDRKNLLDKFRQHDAMSTPMELRIINRAGGIRWIEIRSSLVPSDSARGNIIEGIARDITERKQAEEEINLLNTSLEQRVLDRTAQLEAANKELEAFAYSVSHDLRAPLRALDNLAAAMQEDYAASLDEQGHKYLGFIRRSSQHMSEMVDDLLRLSRISRSDIYRIGLDLSSMAEKIAQELQAAEPERQVVWRIQPGIICEADPNLIQIAMENLLGNAWKFTSRRSQTQIEVGIKIVAGETIYFIRDNGAGFDMSYSHRLFSPFQRLHTDSDFQGTGLGLATVQRIIHRHNGRIWAESSVDEGATIFFTLGPV